MTAHRLLARLKAQGVRVSASGNKVTVEGRLSRQDRRALDRLERDVVRELTRQAPPPAAAPRLGWHWLPNGGVQFEPRKDGLDWQELYPDSPFARRPPPGRGEVVDTESGNAAAVMSRLGAVVHAAGAPWRAMVAWLDSRGRA